MVPALDLPGPSPSEVGGAIVTKAGSSFVEAVTKALSDASRQVGRGLLDFVGAQGAVRFDSGWWTNESAVDLRNTVLMISASLMVGCLFLGALQGLLAGDTSMAVRATIVDAPLSVLGTVALAGVVGLLAAAVDAASTEVIRRTPGDVTEFATGATGTATTTLVGTLAMLAFLIAALLVWVELLVRAALIYLLVAMAPLLLAVRIWPAAKAVWKRYLELLLALVVSKLVVALALAVGAAALAGKGEPVPGGAPAQEGQSLSGLLGGAVLMALAAFAPYLVLKLVPIAEAAVVASSVRQSASRTVMTGAMMSNQVSRLAGHTRTSGTGPSAAQNGANESAIAGGATGGSAGEIAAAGSGPGVASAGSGAAGTAAAGAGATAATAGVAAPVAVATTAAEAAKSTARTVRSATEDLAQGSSSDGEQR